MLGKLRLMVGGKKTQQHRKAGLKGGKINQQGEDKSLRGSTCSKLIIWFIKQIPLCTNLPSTFKEPSLHLHG